MDSGYDTHQKHAAPIWTIRRSPGGVQEESRRSPGPVYVMKMCHRNHYDQSGVIEMEDRFGLGTDSK